MYLSGPMTAVVGGVALLVLAPRAFCRHTEAAAGSVYKVAQDEGVLARWYSGRF
jgi:hypothetical protein